MDYTNKEIISFALGVGACSQFFGEEPPRLKTDTKPSNIKGISGMYLI